MQRHPRITVVLAALLIVGLVLGACQSAPAPSGPAKAEAPRAEAPKAEVSKAAEPAKPAETKPAEAKPAEAAKPVETKVEAKPAAKEPYKVGATAPLSGPGAAYGIDMRDTFALEVERVNAAGGIDGHPVELIVEDDALDPTRASTAFTKLIRQDKVVAILGPMANIYEPAVRPITEREQVPEIIPAPTSAEIRAKNYKWSFNTAPSDIIATEAMIEILKAKGFKKVVAVSETSGPTYLAMFDKLNADAPKAGTQVVALSDTYNGKEVDLTPIMIKLKDLVAKDKPDAVVVVGSAFSIPFIKTMRQLAIDLPVVGTHALGTPVTLDQGGDAVNGALFPSGRYYVADQLDNADPQKAVVSDFRKRFQAKYGKEPALGAIAGGFADAANILFGAMKGTDGDRAKLRDAIEGTKSFVGVSGIFNFSPTDHEGLTKQSMVMYQIKDKKFTLMGTIK